jgi:hypothetical protein
VCGAHARPSQTAFPTADLDVPLAEYVRYLCTLLDVPVQETNLVQSLHVLFTLFSEFKSSQHFRQERRQSIINRMQSSKPGRAITPPVGPGRSISSPSQSGSLHVASPRTQRRMLHNLREVSPTPEE